MNPYDNFTLYFPNPDPDNAGCRLVGNGGDSSNGSEGMLPSTSTGPPFPMARWVSQTHRNFVSRASYNRTFSTIPSFRSSKGLGSLPSGWARVGQLSSFPGNRDAIKMDFDQRGSKKVVGSEIVTPAYYAVHLEDDLGGGGTVLVPSMPAATHDD